jgi:hypothetical protein
MGHLVMVFFINSDIKSFLVTEHVDGFGFTCLDDYSGRPSICLVWAMEERSVFQASSFSILCLGDGRV